MIPTRHRLDKFGDEKRSPEPIVGMDSDRHDFGHRESTNYKSLGFHPNPRSTTRFAWKVSNQTGSEAHCENRDPAFLVPHRIAASPRVSRISAVELQDAILELQSRKARLHRLAGQHRQIQPTPFRFGGETLSSGSGLELLPITIGNDWGWNNALRRLLRLH